MQALYSKLSFLGLKHKICTNGIKAISLCASRLASQIEAHETTIDGGKLFWEKTGCGPHNVFLLPGALGSTRTDFSPQLNNLDKSAFTIYAWDPPGYGKSRPPNRSWPDKFFSRDASQAAQLIESIGNSTTTIPVPYYTNLTYQISCINLLHLGTRPLKG